MKTIQHFSDKFAISLSLLCAIHCIVLPLLVLLLPSLAALPLENEAFHLWMVIIVVPTSLFALTMGCKKHKRYQLLIFGTVGIGLLVLAVVLGEETIGNWEKVLTMAGAVIIAIGHYRNFRLCQNKTPCEHTA